MSERDHTNTALVKAREEWQNLQKIANDAKKAPKLVRSGKAADHRRLADEKLVEVFALEQKLEALPADEFVNLVQEWVDTPEEEREGSVVVIAESKPWWKFW